jgi:hypothetical protein
MTFRRRNRPTDLPIEITLNDLFFLFDREIPIGPEGLVEVGRQDDLVVYAETAEGPHPRVFVSSPRNSKPWPVISRSFPWDRMVLPPQRMPARRNHRNLVTSRLGLGNYAYAGSEPDVPLEGLSSIATTEEGYTVYADATQQPPVDLLMDTGADVVRFVC